MPKRRTSVALAALALFGLCVFAEGTAIAKTPDEVRAACRAEGRPCVGLVLSGGGARGFAHVGVIRVLEELGVKIDVIAGTSMGSMVGGAYAAGFTLPELEDAVLGVDWDRMLGPRPDRQLVNWRRKLDDYKSLPSSGLEMSREVTPMLPAAFVPSEELELFLARKTSAFDMVRDLSRLPIPFAAPATNLVTGYRVVMQKDCTLREAMRASMSIPGAFAPSQYKGELLVDGGLVDNLPVALAREMGADVVIAVNVGTPLSDKEKLTNVVGVIAQMVNLLTEQNVRKSLSELSPGDILITPDLTEYSSADLKKSAEIIARGEEAGRKAAERLKGLARPKTEWTAWNKARTELFDPPEKKKTRVYEVLVAEDKNSRIPPERTIERAAIRPGSVRTRSELDAAARSVFADGYFESVTYRLDPGPDGTSVVVLEPREKDSVWSSVRFGGSLETDFDKVSSFNFLFAHSWHLLNSWGAEWRNEIQIGERQRFLSEFYQPLGTTLPLFIQPSISFERQSYDIYGTEGRQAIARWRATQFDSQVLFGWEMARLGYAGISAGWISMRAKPEIGRDPPPQERYDAPYVGAHLFLDTLDNVSFPTKGYRLTAEGRTSDENIDGRGGTHVFEVNVLVPWSREKWTALLEAEIGRSTVAGTFQLGGASRMVGSPYGRWSGSRLEYARFALARNISEFMPLQAPVWAGMQAEFGRAWNSVMGDDLTSGGRDWQKSVSAYVGIDSLIGPVMLTVGRTMGKGTGIYFLWGYRE